MARQSREAQNVVVPIRTPRLRPPHGLPDAVRCRFIDLVNAAPAEHFRETDAPLLVRYAEVCVMLDAEHVEIGDYVRLTRLQQSLARSLRLCPSARGHHRTTARMKTTGSFYDTIQND